MGASFYRLHDLLYRYHNGTISVQETDELMHLIDQSRNDEELSNALKKIWEELSHEDPIFSQNDFHRMLNGILTPEAQDTYDDEPENIRSFPWIRYAVAAILVLAGLGTFYTFRQSNLAKHPSGATAQIISPGGNRAILTLADGRAILLDSAKTGLLAQQGSMEITKTKEGQLEYHQGKNNGAPSTKINTISTPYGGQYQIVLPDGSRVWLNAASSIRFPTAFGLDERRVLISGEVYFEVKKDASKPFKVQFGNSEVEVLGTSFNIMAYPDETTTQTTLVEGAVRLKSTKDTKKLIPGQQASIKTNGQVDIQSIDTEEAIAWKKGLFYFKEANLPTVMKQVARWYDIEVHFEGKIPERQFTGKVSRNVKIAELLDMLNYTGMHYRIEGRKLVITR